MAGTLSPALFSQLLFIALGATGISTLLLLGLLCWDWKRGRLW